MSGKLTVFRPPVAVPAPPVRRNLVPAVADAVGPAGVCTRGGMAHKAVEKFAINRRLSREIEEILLATLDCVAVEDPEGVEFLCGYLRLAPQKVTTKEPL
jgi:hypothetical protein